MNKYRSLKLFIVVVILGLVSFVLLWISLGNDWWRKRKYKNMQRQEILTRDLVRQDVNLFAQPTKSSPLVQATKNEVSQLNPDSLNVQKLTEKEIIVIADKFNLADDRQSALTLLHRALNVYPNSGLIYQRIGDNYMELLEYEKAVSAYNKSIELRSKNNIAYYRLYDFYHSVLNNNGKAKKVLEHLLQAEPDNSFAKKMMHNL